jgi:hypothetical protein
VAEDSLIPICNSPTSEESLRLRSGPPSEVSYLQIKDVKPGYLVLSLNESTGKFEWQKVEKTLDKGYQEVYELVTEGGKRTETTGNHPYLVRKEELLGLLGGFSVESNIHQQNSNNKQPANNQKSSVEIYKQGFTHSSNPSSNLTATIKENIAKTISYVNNQNPAGLFGR